MTTISNCILKYPLTYTQLQTMFLANPPILCPCHDVLCYIVKRREYRLWIWKCLLLIWGLALISSITSNKLCKSVWDPGSPLNSGVLQKEYFENVWNKVPTTQFIFSNWYYYGHDYLSLCLFNERTCYSRTKINLIILLMFSWMSRKYHAMFIMSNNYLLNENCNQK